MNADPDLPTPTETPNEAPSDATVDPASNAPDATVATVATAEAAETPMDAAAPPPVDAPPPLSGAGAEDSGSNRTIWGVVAIAAVLLAMVWLFRGCSTDSSEPAMDVTPSAAEPTVDAATLEIPPDAATSDAMATESGAGSATPAGMGTAPAASPQVVISGPATGTVGSPIAFSAVTVGSGNPIALYRWDFGDGGRTDGAEVVHVYDLAGTFLVVLTAVDSTGQWARAEHRITLQPAPQQPPSAAISGPTSARAGTNLTFDGSASTAGDAAISSYAWSFGDGGTASGASVTHTFAQPGSYHVSLTVTDANGLADSATQAVQISLPDPPQAVISGPSEARIGQVVTFEGSGSTSGSPIDRYDWNFGDGGLATGTRVTYAYGQAGTFTVVLTVIDRSGARSSANHRIVIQPDPARPPTAALTGPDEAPVNTPVTFSAAGSSPGSSAVTRHDWFVNGIPIAGAIANTLTYTFARPGDFTVTVVVTDQNGLSDAANHAIAIVPDFSSTVWRLEGSDPPITLTAGEGSATGSAGCNTYQASYTATGDATSGTLVVSDLTTTFRVCDDEVMAREQAYLDALRQVTSYAIAGNRLTLRGGGGSLSYGLEMGAVP